MKFVNLIIGFVVFSLVVTLMFTATRDLTSEYEANNAADFVLLAGEYEGYVGNLTTSSDSTIRSMDNQTKTGTASSEDADINIVTGGLSAVRLISNIFPIMGKVLYKAQTSLGGFIHPLIWAAIIGIIAVVIILTVITMIMRMRPEI